MIALLAVAFAAALLGVPQDPQPARFRAQGVVVDAVGAPVRAAEVWLTPAYEPETVLARGHTDGAGFYVLPTAVAQPLKVHARAPGKIQGHAWIESRLPSAALHTVRLWDAITLRGRVTDSVGAPVAGAVVAAGPVRRIGLLIDTVQTRTGSDGRYELSHAPMGEVWLSAWLAGQTAATRTAVLTPGVEQDLALGPGPPRGFTIDVKGLPADVSPKGWRVALSHASGTERVLPQVLCAGTLDAAGRWQIAGLPEDQAFHIRVTDPSGQWFCDRAIWPTRDRSNRFELATSRAESDSWEVVLVDPDDTPLAGQQLLLSLGGTSTVVTTAADGAASITAPCGAGRWCSARLIGTTEWILAAREQHDDEDGPRYANQRPDPVTLAAIPAALLGGKLVGRDGVALSGCNVVLEEWNGNRSPRWVPLAHARSDAKGRFHMAGLYPYRRTLRLRVARTRTLWRIDGELKSGEILDLGAVVGAAAGAIEGRVVDNVGSPIAGARVFLIQIQKVGGDQVEVLTGADGRFSFSPAQPGQWTARVYWAVNRHFEDGGGTIEVSAGQTAVRELRASRR